MKLTELTAKFDNGDSFEYRSAEGFDLGTILGNLGLSAEGIANAESGTIQGAVFSLLNIGLSLLAAKYGLPLSS
jgi:hypothetical protein